MTDTDRIAEEKRQNEANARQAQKEAAEARRKREEEEDPARWYDD